MTDEKNVTPGGEADDGDNRPLPVSASAVAAYESMLAQVPDAGGDGYERILAAVAAAQDVTDLDAPWRSSDLEALVGIPLTITGIAKMPSSYEGGLPWFLVVDAIMETTGERITATTGAVSVVAQLAKAHQLGGFPLRARVQVSERESARGFRPQHLEMLGQAPRAAAAAASS